MLQAGYEDLASGREPAELARTDFEDMGARLVGTAEDEQRQRAT